MLNILDSSPRALSSPYWLRSENGYSANKQPRQRIEAERNHDKTNGITP